MQSNVWLTLKWHVSALKFYYQKLFRFPPHFKDFQLKWNPVNYGGIKELYRDHAMLYKSIIL
jgi:hypothetical protein